MILGVVITILACLAISLFSYFFADDNSVLSLLFVGLFVLIVLGAQISMYLEGFDAYRSVCPECGYVCTDEEFTNCPKDGHELIVAWESEKDE